MVPIRPLACDSQKHVHLCQESKKNDPITLNSIVPPRNIGKQSGRQIQFHTTNYVELALYTTYDNVILPSKQTTNTYLGR